MKNLFSILIITVFSSSIVLAQKSFEDIFLEAPDLIGQTFQIEGVISHGERNHKEEHTHYMIYDLEDPDYKLRFMPELNHRDDNNLKQQIDWVLRNCLVNKCEQKMKIIILWAKDPKIPVVKIVEIDSPKTNYQLNLDNIDATAIALYFDQIVNKKIKMDISYNGSRKAVRGNPLHYWGRGTMDFKKINNDKFREEDIFEYYDLYDEIKFKDNRIPKKFKKFIRKNCSKKRIEKCHFKISGVFEDRESHFKEKNLIKPSLNWGDFARLVNYDGALQMIGLSDVEFLEVLKK